MTLLTMFQQNQWDDVRTNITVLLTSLAIQVDKLKRLNHVLEEEYQITHILASVQKDYIIENAQRHFQGSLLGCFEYVPYTALTIVCTINVSIDCKKNKVSNHSTRKVYLIENQSNEMLGLCFVIK